MSDQPFERAVTDWLEDGSDRTPRRAIDGVLLAVKTTPQERDLLIPWRFPQMLGLSRMTGLAAAALVAVIGAGALLYVNSNGRGGPGGQATSAPSQAPTITPIPEPSYPGIAGWTTYTSAVYGNTLFYPSNWSVYAPANIKWQPGLTASDATNWTDVFINDEAVDGDSIAMWAWQMPAPTGADLLSWEGLETMVENLCGESPLEACPSDDAAIRMCVGQQGCQPAIIVLVGEELTPEAFFGDPETGIVTVFNLGREDNFPAAARYGGSIELLKSILTRVDVREPKPGETPH